jgi:hypothetical protein
VTTVKAVGDVYMGLQPNDLLPDGSAFPVPLGTITSVFVGTDGCWGGNCYVQSVCQSVVDGGVSCVTPQTLNATWLLPQMRFTLGVHSTSDARPTFFDWRRWKFNGCIRQGCFDSLHVPVCYEGETCLPPAPGDGAYGCIAVTPPPPAP